jgi:hypothetical protein
LDAALLLPVNAVCAPAGSEQTAQQILDTAGVKGGLIVHLGCGDGELAAALRANDPCTVQGLDADNNAVAHDDLVGPPRPFQWINDPLRSRSHLGMPSINSLISAKGRLFSIKEYIRGAAGSAGKVLSGVPQRAQRY